MESKKHEPTPLQRCLLHMTNVSRILFTFSVLTLLSISCWFVTRENSLTSIMTLTKQIWMAENNDLIVMNSVAESNIEPVLHKFDPARTHKMDKLSRVAIGMGVISKKMKTYPSLRETVLGIPLFAQFLPSFCDTASPGYNYTFYVAHDDNDPFYTNQTTLKIWKEVFSNITGTKCLKRVGDVGLKLIKLNHSGRLVWAQNDAMLVAYRDNAEYYYRVNDDTALITPNWTDTFIRELKQMHPPLVGVVGPNHKGGNLNILTYDFVHRTHIDIFGYYYPRNFSWWYADNWITQIYKPDRSKKIQQIRILHSMSLGSRYKIQYMSHGLINTLVRIAQEKIHSYLEKVGYKEPQRLKVPEVATKTKMGPN